MKEEILTAKEWLEKENYYDYIFQETISSDIMERYANYKTQMLQGKIFQFREILKSKNFGAFNYILSRMGGNGGVLNTTKNDAKKAVKKIEKMEISITLKEYDEHFNLTAVTKGKINQDDI